MPKFRKIFQSALARRRRREVRKPLRQVKLAKMGDTSEPFTNNLGLRKYPHSGLCESQAV
jgi:hypothetical protein